MNKIELYQSTIRDSYAISSPLLLSTMLQQITSEKEKLSLELKESGSIKVPIVGDFNAGKSSMLNAFVGNNALLPVDITPETAVAYELYYGIDEHVDLYRDNIKIEECHISEIKKLNTKAGDIAKVYVRSDKIRDLEIKGITLVDMPGIDSGIKEHNDAILNYINSGTVFVLLVDCGGGSIRQSTLSFISELSKYNLKPAIFVSKYEKKSESALKDIIDYIGFQARKAMDSQPVIGKISSHQNDIADFEQFINSLDVDKLINLKYGARVKSFIEQQISSLTNQANIYASDIKNVEEQIEAIEKEKLNAEQKIKNTQIGDSPEKSTQDVLDLVHSSLRNHSEEIAQMVIDREEPSAINARILNYIRPVIILAFKEEANQFATAMNTVVDDISTALQNNISVDGNIFDNLVDSFRDDIIGGISVAADILIAMPNIFAKALGWVLQILGEKIPDVIKWVLGKSKEDILLDVKCKLDKNVLPQIIERLRPNILEQITAQQERIRNNISKDIANKLSNTQDAMMNSAETTDPAELKAKISDINSAIARIQGFKSAI